LHRKLTGLFALEDAINIRGSEPAMRDNVRANGCQTAADFRFGSKSDIAG
jgi:hypothetical protein